MSLFFVNEMNYFSSPYFILFKVIFKSSILLAPGKIIFYRFPIYRSIILLTVPLTDGFAGNSNLVVLASEISIVLFIRVSV